MTKKLYSTLLMLYMKVFRFFFQGVKLVFQHPFLKNFVTFGIWNLKRILTCVLYVSIVSAHETTRPSLASPTLSLIDRSAAKKI